MIPSSFKRVVPRQQEGLRDLRVKIEQALHNRKDCVISSSGNTRLVEGVTDISFEYDSKKHQKRVSFYFKTDEEGIKTYQKAARMISDKISDEKVEMRFTPHFGQSRITFRWEHFWSLANTKRLTFFLPDQTPQLPQKEKNQQVLPER
eukprot:Lithocolla_globosa_v1_NODE_11154_length_531_cov_8.600840.p1 type:complete len:148 gc:universal NODE_11154_length_531_cov_8.600840:446-3(-)